MALRRTRARTKPPLRNAYAAVRVLRFFDHYLKGVDTGLDNKKQLFYFTVGEERWKVTDQWPIAGATMTSWYFNENRFT